MNKVVHSKSKTLEKRGLANYRDAKSWRGLHITLSISVPSLLVSGYTLLSFSFLQVQVHAYVDDVIVGKTT